MTFHETVLRWMKANGWSHAVDVLGVTGDVDMDRGDTEEGFWFEFGVRITYRDTTGNSNTAAVDGDEMASLWAAVVGAFPAESTKEG